MLGLSGVLMVTKQARGQSDPFYSPVHTEGRFTADIQYGPFSAEKLDVCTPTGSGQTHAGILLIHGGSWVEGDKSGNLHAICEKMSNAGFVAVNIDYRLANKATPTPGWPATQVGDSQLALRWMRVHSAEIGLDPSRICVYGVSAGGYLTLYLGTTQRIVPSDVANIAPHVPVTISCMIDAFGPTNFTSSGGWTKQTLPMLGFPYNSNPEAYKHISPLFHVSAKTPPTLIIHGDHDHLVPIKQSEELHSALKANHVPAQLFIYHGGHGYRFVTPDEKKIIWQQVIKFAQDHTDNKMVQQGIDAGK